MIMTFANELRETWNSMAGVEKFLGVFFLLMIPINFMLQDFFYALLWTVMTFQYWVIAWYGTVVRELTGALDRLIKAYR